MVLDVSKFKNSHPGGNFMIYHNIGRDVSKFFYGGYTLDNEHGAKPYAHSNVARKIVNKLLIAHLNKNALDRLVTISNKH